MNVICKLFALAASLAAACANGAETTGDVPYRVGPTGEGFWLHEATASNLTLTLSILTNRFTPRDPVMISLAMKNVGSTPILFGYSEPSPIVNFRLEVRNSRGEPVRVTHFQEQDRQDSSEYGGGGHDIAPNEAVKYLIRLNATFDLSLPGRYHVQASRRLASDVRKGLNSTNCLRSNIVTFDMDATGEAIPLYRYVNQDETFVPPYLERRK